MKLYNVVTLVMFLFSSATALKIDLGIADLGLKLDLDHLAVRILLNRGQPSKDGSFCSSEDEKLLQASLNQVLPFTRRNLRAGGEQGRELVNCRQACQGFAPGSCYVVYSGCTRYRRELSEEEEENEQEDQERNTNEDTPRFLQTSMEGIELLFENTCSGIMKRVENQLVAIIKEIDDGLSSPCSTLARKKMRVECELMLD